MLAIRLVKTMMVASLALFALLAAYNNLADYDSNYAFVRHTLSMDTTFPDNALKGRAITSPVVWTLAYWLIILTEAVLVSVFGGPMGVAVGIAGSQFTSVGVTPAIAVYSIFRAFGAAALCGLFFGTYPAALAAAMRPIDALRFE